MPTTNSCGALAAGLTAFECGKIAASGTRKRVVLVNFDDIDRDSLTITSGVIAALPLKSGKIGYLFSCAENAATGEATLAKGKYVNAYDHAVTLRSLVKNQSAKNFVNGLNGTRLVAIVENLDEGNAGDTKFEVYGLKSGLVLTEVPFSTELSDGVVYAIKIASDDTSKEDQLPVSFYTTSIAATEAAFVSLYTPAD